MKGIKYGLAFVLSLFIIQWMLQGCSTTLPLVSAYTSAPIPAATKSMTPIPDNTPSPAPTVPVLSTDMYTDTVKPAVTPPSVDESSLVYLEHVNNGPVCNAYTASDKNYIYFTSGSGVFVRDKQGREKKLTGFKDFYSFVYLDAKSIYYIASDKEYVPTDNEYNWQWCNSYNLMKYDIRTKKSQVIRKHLADVTEYNGLIYMIDHKNHAYVYSYNISKKSFTRVSGLPKRVDDNNNANLLKHDNALYFYYFDFQYSISGNKATVAPVNPDYTEKPVTLNTSDLVYHNEIICIWTGTEYKALDVGDMIGYAFDTGKKKYIIGENWSAIINGSEGVHETLCEISSEGITIRLGEWFSEQCGEGLDFEYVDGWIFAFWESDGSSAESIFFKHYVG